MVFFVSIKPIVFLDSSKLNYCCFSRNTHKGVFLAVKMVFQAVKMAQALVRVPTLVLASPLREVSFLRSVSRLGDTAVKMRLHQAQSPQAETLRGMGCP